ncbi:hypothetical protein Gorai_003268 [Gossypium raimondii]|uniref:Uncharacterized protein n=1 Tax=Gossypium raimondii TaxID=29730 RepID=A0A7J8QPA2_GOSRA|nr:hypothetical protein [Gossypium raimondii]
MRVWHLFLPLLVQFQRQKWMPDLHSSYSVMCSFSMIFLFQAFLLNKQRKHLMWQETALSFFQLCYPHHPNKMLLRMT